MNCFFHKSQKAIVCLLFTTYISLFSVIQADAQTKNRSKQEETSKPAESKDKRNEKADEKDETYTQNMAAASSDPFSYSVNGDIGSYYKVSVNSVIEKSTTDGKVVNGINYYYDFADRDSIFIVGLGKVSPKGNFNYLLSGNRLIFKESSEGPIISIVYLEETTNSVGAVTVELPKEGDFIDAFRSNIWESKEEFPVVASKIIQDYFPSGYRPSQDGQISSYITTYRNLNVPDRNLKSQVAIRISQPYDVMNKKFVYHIQFVARDRPRLSDTWRYGNKIDQFTLSESQKLLDELMKAFDKYSNKKVNN